MSAPTIKAIETMLNGWRFRSRLEARFSVMFGVLNLSHEYESQGFDLGGGIRYLPDFYLPALKLFIEIKGEEPTDAEQQKCIALARGSQHPVILFAGTPSVFPQGLAYYDSEHHGMQDGLPARFIQCRHCGHVGMEADTENGNVVQWLDCTCRATINHNPAIVQRAVYSARAARFEHGEKG